MAKAKKVRLLVLDVDGVLTDGKLYIAGAGIELKAFDVRDGSAIVRARERDLIVAWVSGRRSDGVSQRARELGVTELYQGVNDKEKIFDRLRKTYACSRQEMGYVGDDLSDLPLFRKVGFSAAVSDAPPDVGEQADYRTRAPGGGGAVREVIDLILNSRQKDGA